MKKYVIEQVENVISELKQDGMWNDIDNREQMIENLQNDLGYSREKATKFYDEELSKYAINCIKQ